MAIKLEDWLPQEPWQGPPLPEYLSIYWPWYKPPVTPGAELAITLANPNALVEGTSYPATVTVTNKSTKLGQPVAATMTVKITSVLNSSLLAPDYSGEQLFGPSQSKPITYSFTVPSGSAGKTGWINARVLDPTGKQLAAATLSIAVQARIPTGAVGYGIIYYDGIPSGGWEAIVSGRQVPTGVPIYLAPEWANYSSFNIVGHIDLTMNGVSLTATQNQDREATPMNGYSVMFSPATLSAEGTYTFVVTLSSGGVVLDTKTFTLVAVAEIVYGADVVVSV